MSNYIPSNNISQSVDKNKNHVQHINCKMPHAVYA